MTTMRTLLGIIVLSTIMGLGSVEAQAPLWQRTNGPSGGEIDHICFDSSGGIFLTTSSFDSVEFDSVVVTRKILVTKNLFHSTDGGATWVQLPTFMNNLHTLPNGDILGQNDTTVDISKDFGQTWKSVLPGTGSIAVTV